MAQKDHEALNVHLGSVLALYSEAVRRGIDLAVADTAGRLVKRTRELLPVRTERSSKFVKNLHLFESITKAQSRGVKGNAVFTMYAKPPGSRYLHLVENGFVARDGRFVKGGHFVRRALESEEPRLMAAVEEVIRNGG